MEKQNGARNDWKKKKKTWLPINNKPNEELQVLPDNTENVTPSHQQGTKKKIKFAPVGSLKDFLLPCRMECWCEASLHGLVANCLNCGRIVCKQEGSGPCYTCGKLVCTKEEKAIINSNTPEGKLLYSKLMTEISKGSTLSYELPTDVPDSSLDDESLKSALALKDKLIDFDQNSTKRTQVIDDEADYFSIQATKWMTKEQRDYVSKKAEEAHNQRHSSRLDRKYTLNLIGREIVEEKEDPSKTSNDPKIQEAIFGSTDPEMEGDESTLKDIHNPALPQPQYLPAKEEKEDASNKKMLNSHSAFFLGSIQASEWDRNLRIQDKEFLEMSDEGVCLTIQQPWASLTMAGIKLHEGRTWYTPHRGRLWIHSGAKQPKKEDIAMAEKTFKFLFYNKEVPFPSHYPTGCLLGCVLVQDCLPQEEYRNQFKTGYVEDPYVLIFSDPFELKVKIPMKGNNKIFKLDPVIHKAAVKSLILK